MVAPRHFPFGTQIENMVDLVLVLGGLKRPKANLFEQRAPSFTSLVWVSI